MIKKSPLSIFRYIDPIRFLADSYEALRAEKPDFSVREWARLMGLRQSTVLSGVLKGDRPIPLNYVQSFSRSLKLGATERKYFEALVGMSRSNTTADLERWISRAQSLYNAVAVELEALEDVRLLEHPLLAGLLQLVDRPDFRYDVRWIQRHLDSAVSARSLRQSFDFLLERGFLALDSSGRLCRIRQRTWARQKRFNPLFAESPGRSFPSIA